MDRFKITMKRMLTSLIVGAAVGMIAAFMIAPGAIEWFQSPATPNPMACVEPVQWALAKMRASIEVAGLVGGVLGVIAVEIYRRVRKPKAKDVAPLAQPQ